MKQPIVFYYPSRVLGGAELLFVRVARALSERGLDVYVVDYLDGVQAQQLANTTVKLLEVRGWQRVRIPKQAILITPLSSIRRAARRCIFPADTKVLLWSLHPMNICALFRHYDDIGRVERNKHLVLKQTQPKAFQIVQCVLRLARDQGGLWPMDEPNRLALEDTLDFELPETYLPVPIEDVNLRSVRQPDTPPRLTWLGRVSHDKICALLRVIDDAEAFATAENIQLRLDVIGEGESLGQLRDRVVSLNHVQVVELGVIKGKELEHYLATVPDLVFAMGTSLLDAARVAVPSVVADPSLELIATGLPYPWLFELDRFSLGRIVTQYDPPRTGRVFADLIACVSDNVGRRDLGRECRSYFEQHHQVDTVVKNLINIMSDCRFTYSSLKKSRILLPHHLYPILLWI
jgi:glycosyltransferase involved in cell wall biosynthesis